MRNKEYLKKSEARIIAYLDNVNNYLKSGNRLSKTLGIDYIYVMKILREMYKKGWVKVHEYNKMSFFELTESAPTKEAMEILGDKQTKINQKFAKLRQ